MTRPATTNPGHPPAPPAPDRSRGPTDDLTRLLDWLADQIRRPTCDDPRRRLTTVAASLYNAVVAALDAHPLTWMPDGRTFCARCLDEPPQLPDAWPCGTLRAIGAALLHQWRPEP
jgi:hypothetical protein